MPIFDSLLDTDFYKFTMAQVAWKRFRDLPVTFAFTNRTRDVRLTDAVPMPALCEELAAAQSLRFRSEELAWLRDSEHTRGLFEDGFLGSLASLELPEVRVERSDDGYRIETTGPWSAVTFWETIVLGIVNELHFRAVTDDREAWKEGARRFGGKLRLFEAHPEVRFAEFGTRRRYSRQWQDYVVAALALRRQLGRQPQLLGTSNVALARKYGLPPVGTMAHEMYMVYAAASDGTDDDLRASHNRVLRDWEAQYGRRLLIALTDTFGSDFFFRDMTGAQAAAWSGLRQDSGDPGMLAGAAVAFYEAHGIDPKTKTVVFSDGLDEGKIVGLHARFADRIGVSFGWGTNLTNDVGARPLSLVMKASAAGGRPTVKLSDNPAKASGPLGEIARYKRVFGHVDGDRVACRY